MKAKNRTQKLPTISVQDTARVLREVRKKLGFTQNQIASALGVSQGTLSKMEAAKAEPSAIQWLRFCVMTGTAPESLIRGRAKA